jgi:hypothetical protein
MERGIATWWDVHQQWRTLRPTSRITSVWIKLTRAEGPLWAPNQLRQSPALGSAFSLLPQFTDASWSKRKRPLPATGTFVKRKTYRDCIPSD